MLSAPQLVRTARSMIFFVAAGATGLALATIVALNRPPRDGRWCFHDDEQMRRYIEGQWHYRPQTEAERREAYDMEVW